MPVFECARCNGMTYSASAGVVDTCPRCGSDRQRVVEGTFDEARRAVRPLHAGDHALMIYDDPGAVAPFCARFLTDGVRAGERVVAGVQGDLREAVCALLDSDAELAIEWQTPASIYGDFDADRIAARYDALIANEQRTVRILAGLDRECAEGVGPEDLSRYETLAHSIITDHGATVVCVY